MVRASAMQSALPRTLQPNRANLMNEKLSTYLRHAITSLPAVFAGLATSGFLTADEAAKLDGELKAFLVGLAAVLAAAVTRWLMRVIAEKAPHLKDIFNGPSGGGAAAVAMTAIAWGALSVAGALSMQSCAVGVDERGNYLLRPDPNTLDVALKYLIRHAPDEDSKGGLVEWEYFDPATGKEIPEEDYAAWGIEEKR